ncbi:MAG: efflux RND transporter periplasmic adaptor subunit [Myxococcales bacterium]|nr:efflux RND transporter periplasmic adaptor subunit [Myxococcales bacterium]
MKLVVRILVFIGVVAVVAGLVWSQYRPVPFKVSGFVEADEIRIGSRVGGRVTAVNVEEGQGTRAGDVLVVLDPFDLRERLESARAELAARRAERDEVVAGPRKQEIAASRARLKLAEAQRTLAQEDQRRVTRLAQQDVASRQRRDEALAQLRVAESTVAAQREELALLEEGSRAEDVARAEALARAAEASVQALERQVDELTIVASVDGVIEALDLRPGDLVGAGVPVLSLLDTSRLWVRAYVPEGRLGIALGQRVRLTVDAYPDRGFAGHISFIATEAEFTPGNVQTPEDRSKQVFRIKVDLDEGLDLLRPGMAADVWFDEPPTRDLQ